MEKECDDIHNNIEGGEKNVIFQDEKKSDALQGLLASESDWQGRRY